MRRRRRRHESIDHNYSAWQSQFVTAADIIKEIKALPPDEQRRVLAEAIEEVSSHEPKETATLLQRAQRRLEHPEVPEDVWEGFEQAEDGKTLIMREGSQRDYG